MSSPTAAPVPFPESATENQKNADEAIEFLEAASEFTHGVDAFSDDGIHGPGNKVYPPKAKSSTTAPVLTPAENQKAEETISYLEAVSEFDHGVDAFDGDGIHHGSRNHPPAPQMRMPHIKPRQMIVNAEKAIEKVIESVGEKMGKGKSQVREKVENQTAEETAAGTMCVTKDAKDIHKESFEAPQ